jgi:signal transduction histidine kinase
MPANRRSTNSIIVMSVGLMLLVSTVVGWLGWRLLTQEEALIHQQARDRLQRTADQMVTKFVRRMQELDSWLARNGPLLTGQPPSTADGAVLVWLSKTDVYVAPLGRLLYYPTTTATVPPANAAFEEVDRLESTRGKLSDAASALVMLTKSKVPSIQAEAMLRLARVQGKLGAVVEALSTYDTLENLLGAGDLLLKENATSGGLMELLRRSDPSQTTYFQIPGQSVLFRDVALAVTASRLATLTNSSGVPYRLLSQFDRAQLLARIGRDDEAREQARRLVSEMSSGRWRLDKASFTLYDGSARKIAGLPPPPPARVAVAEQVTSLWNEWEAFQRGSKFSTTRVYRGGDAPLIALVDTNAERLVALIADGDSVGSVGLDLSTAGANVRALVVDEEDRRILGPKTEPTGLEVVRSLSGAGLPWQLKLIASTEETSTILRARSNYAIMAFSVFVLLVAGASFAIARGVLREAVTRRLQGDFVSAVSHEFRSPLTALRQLTELLAQGRIQDESRRRMYYDVLLKETSRLHLLVESLLDFGRMEAGRRHYQFEAIDLSQVAEEAIHEYRREADASGHRIEFTANSSRLLVDADREAMKRVVRNLVENAVKYSPDALSVSVDTGSDGRMAVLRVRDEGIGVPPEEQSRIFEKFVRGEAAKRACIQGTGIGLSMVKEIVGAHHGQVDLQSEVGRGSTFVVRLPLSEANERSGA